MSSDEQDPAILEWSRWRERAENLAETCQNDPQVALQEGIEPRLERAQRRQPYDRVTATAPVNIKAGWLRAAADKVIPPRFDWIVQELIGGGAVLVLRNLNE